MPNLHIVFTEKDMEAEDFSERSQSVADALMEFLHSAETTARIVGVVGVPIAGCRIVDDSMSTVLIDSRLKWPKKGRADIRTVLAITYLGAEADVWRVTRIASAITHPPAIGSDGEGHEFTLADRESVIVDMARSTDKVMACALLGAISHRGDELVQPSELRHGNYAGLYNLYQTTEKDSEEGSQPG